MTDFGISQDLSPGLIGFQDPDSDRQFIASKSSAETIGRMIEDIEETAEGEGGNITDRSEVYGDLIQFREHLRAVGLRANGTNNPDQINVNFRQVVSSLEEKTGRILRDIEKGVAVDPGVLGSLTAVQFSIDQGLQAGGYAVTDNDAFMPGGALPVYGDAGGSSASGGGSLDNVVGEVKALFDDALAADTPAEKIAIFKDAIDLFSSGVGGSGAGGVGSTDAGSGGGTSSGGDMSGVEMPDATPIAVPSEPVMVDVEHVFKGDTLVGVLGTEDNRALHTGRSGQGKDNEGFGYKKSGEIDNTASVTFDANQTFEGARVTIADNHANSTDGRDKDDGIQETTLIEAKDADGNVVWSQTVRGDVDGIQTVEIDVAFDTIEFSTEDETGSSDFSIMEVVGITTEEREGPAAGGGRVASGGPNSQDVAEFVEGLESVIDQIKMLIANSTVQNSLNNSVIDIAKQAVGSIESNSDGGAELTKAEADALLNSVYAFTQEVQAKSPNSETANEILNTVINAASNFSELADDEG